MRILHTADWHLGARLGPHDRLDDQRTALKALHTTARETKPDIILHCGDVWDTFHPSHDALHTGLKALTGLAAIAPTVVVGGNHDSYKLLRAIDDVLTGDRRRRRLWMVTTPQVLSVGTKTAGNAVVCCLPYLTRAMARREGTSDAPPSERREYAAAIARINARLTEEAASIGDAAARLYAAHVYVSGCRPGRSERHVTVTDDYAAEATDIPELDYAAFGHIHDAQPIGESKMARYSGALVQIGFDEANGRKMTLTVETGDKATRIEEHDNKVGRPLVDFLGTPEELEQRAAKGGLDDCIVKAIVESEERVYDLNERLRKGSPKAAVFELVNRVGNEDAMAITDYDYADVAEPPITELFDEWRKTRGGEQREADETLNALFGESLANAQAPGTSDFGIGALTAEFEEIRARLTGRAQGDDRSQGA